MEGNFATSDHRITYIEVQCPTPQLNTEERKVYLYSKADYSAINKELTQINWEEQLQSRGMEEAWKFFRSKYGELREKYIPHKKVKVGAPHGHDISLLLKQRREGKGKELKHKILDYMLILS